MACCWNSARNGSLGQRRSPARLHGTSSHRVGRADCSDQAKATAVGRRAHCGSRCLHAWIDHQRSHCERQAAESARRCSRPRPVGAGLSRLAGARVAVQQSSGQPLALELDLMGSVKLLVRFGQLEQSRHPYDEHRALCVDERAQQRRSVGKPMASYLTLSARCGGVVVLTKCYIAFPTTYAGGARRRRHRRPGGRGARRPPGLYRRATIQK